MIVCLAPAPVQKDRTELLPSPTTTLPPCDTTSNSHPPFLPPTLTVNRRVSFPVENSNRHPFVDWYFPVLLLATGIVCIGGGLYARKIPPVSRTITQAVVKIKTEFHFSEPEQKIEPPQIIKKVLPKPVEPPVDPTVQKVADTQVPMDDETPPEQPKPQEQKPVRKVFGLRRVYATGLGSGGSMADAVVGKIGNTINKEYDTVTAAESDIKGTVVSTVTVTTAPRFRKVVKPIYTKDMIDRKVQGTVKVKVLVDIDGKVKKATCMNDIGYESAAQAVKATMAMEFDPAMRGGDPVAVWIIVPIRFVLLG